MPNPSEAAVVEFRDVTRTFRRMPAGSAGFKASILNLPGFFRERRRAESFKALDGVSFQVQRGETLGVCGPNGSGKSTLLGLIAGVLRPSSGTVTVNGHVASLLDLGAGFHPDLSGRDNLFLNGAILGLRRKELKHRFDSIVEFSGIGDFIEQPLRTYSSGMLLRLGFSIATSVDADILLVDEVLAVGDLGFQTKCAERLQQMQTAGTTFVIVTHNYPLVKQLCSRGLILQRGQIFAEGSPAEIESAYLEAVGEGKKGAPPADGEHPAGAE